MGWLGQPMRNLGNKSFLLLRLLQQTLAFDRAQQPPMSENFRAPPMGERQSIAQKGVRAIDAQKSAPRNRSSATITSVRAPALSTDEREHPFVWYFGAGWPPKRAGKMVPRENCRKTFWHFLTIFDVFWRGPFPPAPLTIRWKMEANRKTRPEMGNT